jgi:hypothetical protein
MVIAAVVAFLAFNDGKYDHFHEKVLPLLQARCVSCHGPEKQKGGLRLDSRPAILKGGENGPSIDAAKPDASLLLQAVRHSHPDVRMPPKEKLAPDQLAALERWVREGAVWPADAAVLFEDDDGAVEALSEGQGVAKLVDDRNSGRAALKVERQKMAAKIDGWSFKVAEYPGPGEFRYLRFSWKKKGGGAAYFELANDGKWRAEEKLRNAAWVAGKNTTGWAAQPLADEAPSEWTTVTRDLWQDRGTWDAFVVTGMCLTAVDGGEAFLDGVVLGPTLESLDAYRPGRGRSVAAKGTAQRIGDAWSDPENPIRKIFAGKRLDLWSLRKVERPAGTIDSLVAAGLARAGLAPSPEADRRTLIRRVTFDLTGLPPSPEELAAFEADGDYEKLVDRLLASPRYGERWARHWLDVVRYAETQGFERDEFRPLTWRYRDYVVRALNQDKPFDRFIREQLSGDELVDGPPRDAADVDRIVATGFLRLGPWDSTGSIFEENAKNRNELMADLANTTGSAFLGLTMSCANCHDHKYDPISQADHFRLRAFFAGVKPDDQAVTDLGPEQERIRAHNASVDAELEGLKKAVAAILEPARKKAEEERRAKLAEEVRELLAIDEKKRTKEQKEKLKPVLEKLKVSDKDAQALLDGTAKQELEALRKRESEAAARRLPFMHALSIKEDAGKVPATHVFYQGDFTAPREEVPPGFLSVLDPNPAGIEPPADGRTSGRRKALAGWIASPENPLTARVIANRLWHHHFGRGIVATPNDFGFSGARPTHPELLDWLASELVRGGWSLKRLHRTILLSATYRQTSRHDAAKSAADPENRLLWRQNPRRLEAEAVRDAMLAVSGRLLPKDSGPSVWPPVPQDLLTAQPGILETKDDKAAQERRQGWYADALEKTDVRSIFLIQKRVLAIPFLEPFDLPESTASCGRRDCTVVAPQALSLLNSDFTERASVAFAERVRKESPDRPVERALRLALGRAPSPAEAAIGERVLSEHARIHARKPDPRQAALVDLCRALLNVNEFIYVD